MSKNDEGTIANPESVRAYLLRTYELTEQKAGELVATYADMIKSDSEMSSWAYWTGDKIAAEERLLPRDDEDMMEEDDDDDDDE